MSSDCKRQQYHKMKRFITILIYCLSLLSLWLGISFAKAQTAIPNFHDIVLPHSRFSSLNEILGAVINWSLILAGALATIAIAVSGIMYITSGGDQTKAEAAKKNLAWAIIGLVLILLSLVIVNFIGNTLFR